MIQAEKSRVVPKFRFEPRPVSRSLPIRLEELEKIYFSLNHRHAYWFGLVLTFSAKQAACWKVLWDNLFRGNLPIPNERILSACDGETTHIYHHFKRHDAWTKEIIVGDGKGNFWLRLPSEADALPERANLSDRHDSPPSEGGSAHS